VLKQGRWEEAVLRRLMLKKLTAFLASLAATLTISVAAPAAE
jgi:hypothetical protein